MPDGIGHATRIASVIDEKCEYGVTIYSIKIFEHTLEPVNFEKLVIALNWCLINDIDVINLSMGSVQFTDRVRFVELMTEN
ncbi:S8 family serine peptidase [Tissierella carlieri]|uniref:S8 family serine peptidase n=1 Tax=Tissierella carlieri TaxID=689904 RepID=UPI001C1226BE|nr:S8 family serine peptidase [Tissierella carlieri]MBU5310461.1 S8 family serine peptidase [Tissierella carlieri]